MPWYKVIIPQAVALDPDRFGLYMQQNIKNILKPIGTQMSLSGLKLPVPKTRAPCRLIIYIKNGKLAIGTKGLNHRHRKYTILKTREAS